MNKICVYAICKNELKFVDRWLDSMSEADYIVVLDTGSTDGTFEKLQNDERVTKVEQKVIKPWRFDVARNESMKLVPDDANILVCTDFDEFFESGWGSILRDNWTEECTMCHYLYAWSHNDDGQPGDVFTYNKIHTRDYHWRFPVHEVLVPNDLTMNHCVLEAGEAIYLHHTQDKSKPRANYMDLLKLSVEENPEDSHTLMLLAREYLISDKLDEALNYYLEVEKREEIYEGEKILIALETFGRIADIYRVKDNFDKAHEYCYKFLHYNDEYREPYIIMTKVYVGVGHLYLAKSTIETAIKYCKRKYTWVERAPSWQDEPYALLGSLCNDVGEKQEAIDNYEKALQYNSSNQLVLKDLVDIYKSMRNEAN